MVLQALEAQQLLAEHHDVAADVWSVPGWKQLRDDAIDCERWNRLHPTEAPRTPYVTEQLGDTDGPIVAVTDWVKAVPDSIARFVPQPYVVLGTDGYGFSDVRPALRRHFEVDAAHVTCRGARRARADRRRQGRGGRRRDPPLRDRPRVAVAPPDLTLARIRVNFDLVVGVPVLVFVLVVPLVVVVDVLVGLLGDVGERAGAFAEQPVVVALLELPRFTEPARSSFSGHVVTCLGVGRAQRQPTLAGMMTGWRPAVFVTPPPCFDDHPGDPGGARCVLS